MSQSRFSAAFLDDLRARVKVSEVVKRKFTLVRDGSELCAKEDVSIKVNDRKGLWFDFGKSNDGGDHFKFLQEHEGVSFVEAVKIVASIAGFDLSESKGGAQQVSKAADDSGHAGVDIRNDRQHPKTKREINRVYEYRGYQVVRFLHTKPDGSTFKSFGQRRQAPDGKWIWGLKVVDEHGTPLEFMTKGNRDWVRYDPDKFTEHRYERRATFEELGNLRHGLYKADELDDDIADGREIWFPEGEKDVETLRGWGFAATTNSGGAQNLSQIDWNLFRDLDVVLPVDNDEAGHRRAEVVGQSLKGIAKSLRIVDFARLLGNVPKGFDITDWKEDRGGTGEALRELAKSAPQWTPAPRVSRFGRIRWADQDGGHVSEYEWIVKGVIPRQETAVLAGPSRSGKSFEAFNLSMHISLGKTYRGCRTKQGLVIYVAAEGGKGFRDRMRAYRQHHGLPLTGVPFELLTKRADLFRDDKDLDELIKEMAGIVEEWRGQSELSMVVLDTYSAVTPGIKENASEDISRVRERILKIQDSLGCTVLIVDHMNAEGTKTRGHTSKLADVECQLEVRRVVKVENKMLVEQRDENGRVLRRLTVMKQREGEDGKHWDFVLERRVVRKDADGDDVPSCVSVDPARPDGYSDEHQEFKSKPKGDGFKLNKGEVSFVKALLKALDKHGITPPPGIEVERGVRKVVDWHAIVEAYKAEVPNEEAKDEKGRERYKWKISTAMKRARQALLDGSVVGVAKLPGEDGQHVVWMTGKKVWSTLGFKWPLYVVEDKPLNGLDEPGSILDFIEPAE